MPRRDAFEPVDPRKQSVIMLDPPTGQLWPAEDRSWLTGLPVAEATERLLGCPTEGDLHGRVVGQQEIGGGLKLALTLSHD